MTAMGVETCFEGLDLKSIGTERLEQKIGGIRRTRVSAYLGGYCSDEGFVESASLVQVHHSVSAGLAA